MPGQDRGAPGLRGGRERTRRRGGRYLALAAGALLAGSVSALAQGEAVKLSVPATIVAEAASQAAFPIEVGPADLVPRQSFVRLRGLPATVSLSEGHAIAPGAWAIPLNGLATLKANVPAGVSGRSELTLNLVALDGTLLAEARTTFVVAPPAVMAPDKGGEAGARRSGFVAPTAPAAKERPAPRAPELSAEDKARAERFLALGEKYFQEGKIASARSFFQRAAELGYAPAALRLAASYDPSELERAGAYGIVPDRAEARKWYEKARELGAPEADERLARLGGS
jgi:hypothetical protein